MRRTLSTLLAMSLAVPVSYAIPMTASDAVARSRHYSSRAHYGYRSCRHSKGTTGLVVGGVGGALVGSQVIGHGPVGPIAGAVGGALAGRAIDRASTRHRRCRYYR